MLYITPNYYFDPLDTGLSDKPKLDPSTRSQSRALNEAGEQTHAMPSTFACPPSLYFCMQENKRSSVRDLKRASYIPLPD